MEKRLFEKENSLNGRCVNRELSQRRGSPQDLVRELCGASRAVRDLFWLEHVAEGNETLDVGTLEDRIPGEVIASLGIERHQESSRKFKARDVYVIPSDLVKRIEDSAAELQMEVDGIASDLYNA